MTKDEHRFWKKVDKTSSKRGCWLWLDKPNPDGYGVFWSNGKAHMAHRLAYTYQLGLPLPSHKDGHHMCKNKLCVRYDPDHVVSTDTKHRGQSHKERTHCPKGHEYTEWNTTIYDGRRYCKQCDTDRYHIKNGERKWQFNLSASSLSKSILVAPKKVN